LAWLDYGLIRLGLLRTLGIRGISELIILDEIMNRVKQTQKLHTTPLLAEYFDLICGTSTGGYQRYSVLTSIAAC
jgi:patatin-like phospholipase/acyl hydrolase